MTEMERVKQEMMESYPILEQSEKGDKHSPYCLCADVTVRLATDTVD